ncbi:MAG: uL13 family ribosomal protein, partial [Chloroflexi bacterium]|nr:uL13 family ribosomal protein [Chloroflexota bacterium]
MPSLRVQKTYVARPSELHPRWHLIDASGKILGRLATEIAEILQGKHQPIYTPHMLTGDFVVVVNAARVRVTGKKLQQ